MSEHTKLNLQTKKNVQEITIIVKTTNKTNTKIVTLLDRDKIKLNTKKFKIIVTCRMQHSRDVIRNKKKTKFRKNLSLFSERFVVTKF